MSAFGGKADMAQLKRRCRTCAWIRRARIKRATAATVKSASLTAPSLAVSQAGVNDLIAPEYSHHRRLLARGSRHSSIALFGSWGRKNPG